MWRALLCVGFGLFAVAATWANQPRQGALELRGKWVFVNAESSGKPLKSAFVWEFGGDKLIKKSSKTSSSTEYQVKVDITKNPKEIDLITKTGSVLKGIYQMQGDTLLICVPGGTGVGKLRPTEFKTKAGDGFMMYTLKRQP